MKMSYITLGTNNMKLAVSFYDSLFDHVDVNKWIPEGRIIVYRGDGFMFALAEPYNEKKATPGNGTMIGFQMDNIQEIIELHTKALNLGGINEGEPGARSKGFSAYVRDLDGNKLCFFCLD